MYGGCLGNANRFLSKSDCEDLCTAQESVELCGKAKMVGSCDGSFPYWYFERELGSCLPCKYQNYKVVRKGTDCIYAPFFS